MADLDDLTPDRRDERISELEQQVSDLSRTVRRQRDTVNALQKTNQSLIEQLQKKCEQYELSDRSTNIITTHKPRSSSIDITASKPTLSTKATHSKPSKPSSFISIYKTQPKIGGLIKIDIASEQRNTIKRQKDSITKMTNEIETLKHTIGEMEQKQKEQCEKQKEYGKKLKKYKYIEKTIQTNIALIQDWHTKLEQNSLQYLGSKPENCRNNTLFENCQKGCIALLEEIYRNKRKDSILSDVSVSEGDSDCKSDGKECRISQEMMVCFSELFRKHIKLTINYASLQQSHNGLVNEFKMLRHDWSEMMPEPSLEHNVDKRLHDFW